ncbi:dihydrofolate reductase family protein [Taklimakanibacter deserti]|uniref:dihydrofolate reductase family protein n=1 Tax=Taklimakanibacter deserti TaxID=2267839 RepID=UPI0013C4A643
MKRLKLQMQVSADGFDASGPADDKAWSEMEPHSRDLLDGADTIVIGRKTAVDFIPYWDEKATQREDPWHEIARRIAEARKVVFSKTLAKSEWTNTDVENGDLAEAIGRLKSTAGKDIIVYGGVSFVSALVKSRLIDEFHLFVNPIALGAGKSIFAGLDEAQRLRLKKSVAYTSGVVLLNYEAFPAE